MSTITEKIITQLGGYEATGRALGISGNAVKKWVSTRVPAERVLKLEAISGVSRHEIRPDIYPLHD